MPEPEQHPARPSRPPWATSRRGFLALLATLGAGALAGCSPASQSVGDLRSHLRQYLLEEPQSLDAPYLGKEPAAFLPPTADYSPAPPPDVQVLRPDVCVVGGGAAGVAAATCAARRGAQTLLLEESYVLGGNVTRGLVNLDKIAYGGGPMVAGYFTEVLDGLVALGAAVSPGPETDYAVPAESDALRHYVLYLARREGVDVRLGAPSLFAQREGARITRVWALQQGRLLDVRAKVFVDCTGDGNLGYQAGCAYWWGDRTHGQIQGQTLIFYLAPVDFVRVARHARATDQHLVSDYQVIGFVDLMKRLRAERPELGPFQKGMLINRNLGPTSVSISASEVYSNQLDPTAAAAMLANLEEQNRAVHARLRDEVPGFERAELFRMAERPYLREGRRIIGYYQLTGKDVVAGNKPMDSVARGWYPMDLHVSYAGGPVHLGAPSPGDWYGIPYRCLVARDADNLLMAGRCISVTHEALGSSRISPTSMALGQAAGIAAALAAETSRRPADVPAAAVQREIVDAGGLI